MLGNKWLIGIAASVSLGAAVFAVCDDDDAKAHVRVLRSNTSDDVQKIVRFDSNQSIELTIENGEVTVARVNGEDVDEDRIHIEDGHIVILDENGDPIEVGQIGIFGGEDGRFGRFTVEFSEDLNAFEGAMNTWRFGTTEAPTGVMLGVHMSDTSKALIKHLRLKPGTTTLIDSVYADLPAALAGAEEFDIVIEVDGLTPADPKAIRKVLSGKVAGDTITLRLISSGDEKEVTVELTEYDASKMPNVFFEGQWDRVPFRNFQQDLMFAPGGASELRDVFVTPQWRFETEIDGTLARFSDRSDVGIYQDAETNKGLGARIERLTERMAELEELLEKVIKEMR